MSQQKITPFLWYHNNAEEAARFYISLFPGSKITRVTHYGESGPGPPGSVMTVEFQLAGLELVALNGGPAFHFTEAISLSVACETQAEIDRLWNQLSTGGQPGPCGWLKDKYGLSWQIVPTVLSPWLNDPDPAKAQRTMQAMLGMSRLDIERLKQAHDGP